MHALSETDDNMPYLIARTNETTGVTDYLLSHDGNDRTWGSQRHKAPRFEAEALLPTLSEPGYRLTIEQETDYHRRASLR